MLRWHSYPLWVSLGFCIRAAKKRMLQSGGLLNWNSQSPITNPGGNSPLALPPASWLHVDSVKAFEVVLTGESAIDPGVRLHHCALPR